MYSYFVTAMIPNTQPEIDLYYYARWEIAAAREDAANKLAFYIAILAASLVHMKYDFWLWDAIVFIGAWWASVYGLAAKTAKAWHSYLNRPILPTGYRE